MTSPRLLLTTTANHLLEVQDGVISHRQALGAGLAADDIDRCRERGLWTEIHPQVYVGRTDPPAWRQRAWAAVLACAPAALGGWSAVRAHEGPGRRGHDDSGPIEVLVAPDRPVNPPEGVVMRRSHRFADVDLALTPPRLPYDTAILDLADRAADDRAAGELLARACGGRRTTAERLSTKARTLPELSRRACLLDVLTAIADDTAHRLRATA